MHYISHQINPYNNSLNLALVSLLSVGKRQRIKRQIKSPNTPGFKSQSCCPQNLIDYPCKILHFHFNKASHRALTQKYIQFISVNNLQPWLKCLVRGVFRVPGITPKENRAVGNVIEWRHSRPWPQAVWIHRWQESKGKTLGNVVHSGYHESKKTKFNEDQLFKSPAELCEGESKPLKMGQCCWRWICDSRPSL